MLVGGCLPKPLLLRQRCGAFFMEKLTHQQVAEGQVLLIDKPLKWTSFDVISKLRRLFKIKKIGHAGTLDPLATGLLIVCTGRFTKKINEYMGMPKEYKGTITLGATTPTYDLESEPTDFKPWQHLQLTDLQAACLRFTGLILQVPPAHSAIKIGGKRVYELARQGKEVKLEPRQVTVDEFTITGVDENRVQFLVRCSTGTYIRSLAHDFGQQLGCGGYLSALRRTKIGEFSVDDADTIETLAERFDTSSIIPKLPMAPAQKG
jgi:tRNA pseudouridine55 synthase